MRSFIFHGDGGCCYYYGRQAAQQVKTKGLTVMTGSIILSFIVKVGFGFDHR
jgi:hypothetical protein